MGHHRRGIFDNIFDRDRHGERGEHGEHGRHGEYDEHGRFRREH